MRLLLLLLILTPAYSEHVPAWVIRGMLMRESSSFMTADGTVVYKNKARGSDGEVGCLQALPSTLRLHKFSPSLFEQDPQYAVEACRAIMVKYYERFKSWEEAIGAWRKGPGKRTSSTAKAYVAEIKKLGNMP